MSEEKTYYQAGEEIEYRKDQDEFAEQQRINSTLITHIEPYKAESSK